jgi:hypothetical protein
MINKKQVLFILLLGLIFIGTNAYLALSRFSLENIRFVIESDALGYYNYSPSLFVHDNILNMSYAMPLKNGYALDKYTCGVAILQLPFFLIAKQLSPVFDLDVTNTRNVAYMFCMAVAVATYLYITLCILFFYIKKRLDLKTAWYSVIVLYFATNVYYYTVMEPGMSHVFSLFCFVMILYFTELYYKNNKLKFIVGLSFFYALAALIRPTNIVILLFFLFYEVYSMKELKLRIQFHLKNYQVFIILLLMGLIVASPQMLYWYAVTGKPIVFSYGYNHESFSNWKSPKVIQVLIGHKSGWLSYTPIMILSLIGLYLGIKAKKISAPVILMVFSITLIVCASWWAYNFACSFGYRSFVEFYAILILPLAFVSHKILNGKNKKRILTFLFVSFLCCFLNMRMTQLYLKGPECWAGADWSWNDYVDAIKRSFFID